MGATRPAGLEEGTRVRSRRAALKRAIRMDRTFGLALLRGEGADDQLETAGSMPVLQLLEAIAGVDRAVELLAERKIPASAALYALTLERRQEIAAAIAGGKEDSR